MSAFRLPASAIPHSLSQEYYSLTPSPAPLPSPRLFHLSLFLCRPQAIMFLSGFDSSVSGVTKAVNKAAPRLTEQLGVCAVPFRCTFVLCTHTTVSLWRSDGYLQAWVPAVHNVAARDSNSGPQAWQQTPSPSEPYRPPSALCFNTGQLRASGSSCLCLCLPELRIKLRS